MTYARLRPMRSPSFELMRMNAAETKASSAIALWTPLAVVCRSRTTAEIDTFMNDVSTTRTNMAAARRIASRGFASPAGGKTSSDWLVIPALRGGGGLYVGLLGRGWTDSDAEPRQVPRSGVDLTVDIQRSGRERHMGEHRGEVCSL